MKGNKAPASAVIHGGVVHAIGAVEPLLDPTYGDYFSEVGIFAAYADFVETPIRAERQGRPRKTRSVRKAERARLRISQANLKVRLLCEQRPWGPSPLLMGTAISWPRHGPWRSLSRTCKAVNCMACIAASVDR